MNYNRIVCLDLEMCCWDDGREKNTGEIIEVGLAEIDLSTGQITQTASFLVKPEHDEISEFCTKLTGHQARAIYKQGRPLADVLQTVIKKFGGKNKIYGAWGRDDAVIREECAAKGIEYPFKEFLNIATLYRIHKRVKNKHFGHRKAMEMESLEWEGRQHNGGVDAYNLARLVRKFM